MKEDKKEFMHLDDADFKILLILIRRSVEFSKLDFADQKVLVWFLAHSPKRVKSWIDYLVDNYSNSSKPLSGVKLYSEIKDLLES